MNVIKVKLLTIKLKELFCINSFWTLFASLSFIQIVYYKWWRWIMASKNSQKIKINTCTINIKKKQTKNDINSIIKVFKNCMK